MTSRPHLCCLTIDSLFKVDLKGQYHEMDQVFVGLIYISRPSKVPGLMFLKFQSKFL